MLGSLPVRHHTATSDHVPHDPASRQLRLRTLRALRHEPRSCSLTEHAEAAGLYCRAAIRDGLPETAYAHAARAARYARLILAAERGQS